MSRINIDALLEPVSQENPAGEDLSDLTDYYVLEDLIAGTGPAGEGATAETDWPRALATAVDMLQRGKELRVTVHLVHALVRLDGMEGLRDGLRLLQGMLERFWETLYPILEEDFADPAEARMNILKELTSGTVEGETISPFVMSVRECRLCNSRQMGSFSWREMLMADGVLPAPEDQERPDPTLVNAAVSDTDPDDMGDLLQTLDEAMELTQAIDVFLTDKAGTGNTARLAKLGQLLGDMRKRLADVAETASPAQTPEAQNPAAENGPASRTPPLAYSADIRTQADVIKAIDAICTYYEHNEKSSPVPLFLKRVKRLVGQDFMTIVKDVARNAEDQVRDLFGTEDDED